MALKLVSVAHDQDAPDLDLVGPDDLDDAVVGLGRIDTDDFSTRARRDQAEERLPHGVSLHTYQLAVTLGQILASDLNPLTQPEGVRVLRETRARPLGHHLFLPPVMHEVGQEEDLPGSGEVAVGQEHLVGELFGAHRR